MNASEFVQKWRGVQLRERAASQEHFLDLCAVFDHPTPAAADKEGDTFTFDRGATKQEGGEGWADVWKKGFFGWEYKGKHKDLEAAYKQLLQYRESLENPPLLVVCDMDRIIVRTNFTGTLSETYEITLETFSKPRNLEILRAVFHDPDKLKPGRTSEAITSEVAGRIGELAQGLRERGLDPHQVARFLDRIVFCMFAEDIGLLPEDLFRNIVEKSREKPARFKAHLKDLFDKMAKGGYFGGDVIRHFNGSLFLEGNVLDLTADEIEKVHHAAHPEWNAVDPSIFGTLFERGMDPDKRSQIGAHYTSRADIETLIEPVVMLPLRREWDETRRTVECLLASGKKKPNGKRAKAPRGAHLEKARREARILIERFRRKLTGIKVLDPACGSGNFLYVTLQKLLDLEKEVSVFQAANDLADVRPQVGPWQLFGIEINDYAHDLAQMVVWIGYLQWMLANGYEVEREPILAGMEGNFQCKDAILDLSDREHPKEPDWPKVDFIVGNPPFLGDKLMRGALGDDYVDKLRALYEGRIPGQSDLCCYWFERARAHVKLGRCKRAGLLATQGIRGGANREVLKRIKESGDIFFAESDREWILDGANVHVSMVGFDDGSDGRRSLDGAETKVIAANLTRGMSTTAAAAQADNRDIAYIGVSMHGPFDLDDSEAVSMLLSSANPNRRPNSDVVCPILNATELTHRQENRWVVALCDDVPIAQAAEYEAPFEFVKQNVKPIRDRNRRKVYRENWWLHGEARPAMLAAIRGVRNFLVTPRVAKHRVFAWLSSPVLPSDALVAFARSDDYFFGVLHSRVHEVWARAQGTQLRERESGFRYTPTTCFETFPLPWPPGKEPVQCVAQPPSAGVGVAQPPSAGSSQSGATVPHAKPAKGEYRRNLPHLQPEGKTFFVTFSTWKRWHLPESVRSLVLEHCIRDHATKVWVHGVVVMPDHVHMVMTPLADENGKFFGLAEILNGIKGASAHAVNKALKHRGHVWQDESFDHVLRSDESAEQKTEYICQNPVRKGLAHTMDEYPWLWRAAVDGENSQSGATVPHDYSQPGAAVLHAAIAQAAKELDELRNNWLNPPAWTTTEILEFPGSVDGPWARYVHDPDKRGIGTVRYPRVVDNGVMPTQLRRRTLTELYNQRPTWLDNAHKKLDEAVLAAYAHVTGDPAWRADMSDEEILEKLLALNLERSA